MIASKEVEFSEKEKQGLKNLLRTIKENTADDFNSHGLQSAPPQTEKPPAVIVR